jgi:nicotinamidase-related amidase
VNAHVDPRSLWPDAEPPPVVFVDMYEEELDAVMASRPELVLPLLTNCRRLLDCARRHGWPTAFVRSSHPPRCFGEVQSHWIEGFKPQRRDMVFERRDVSCYSSEEFAAAINAAGRVFVLSGFCGKKTALMTFVDATRHSHSAGLVRDASVSRPFGGLDAGDAHRATLAFANEFATVISTDLWIALAQSPREGKSALI